jgi:hypothetical protein
MILSFFVKIEVVSEDAKKKEKVNLVGKKGLLDR